MDYFFVPSFKGVNSKKCNLKVNDLFKQVSTPLANGFLGKGSKKKYGIFHTLVGWVGLKKSFSIKKIKNMI